MSTFKIKARELFRLIQNDPSEAMKKFEIEDDEDDVEFLTHKEPPLSGPPPGMGPPSFSLQDLLENVPSINKDELLDFLNGKLPTPPPGMEKIAEAALKELLGLPQSNSQKNPLEPIKKEVEKLLKKKAEEREKHEDKDKDKDKDEELPHTPFWFKRKIQSVIKDNKILRPAGNKRFGDLDMKHLYKLKTTGKVFKHKDIISKKEYTVGLLIDCSGSMQEGRRHLYASRAAVKIVEEFQDLVSLEVMTFNERVTTLKKAEEILKKDQILKIINKVKKETHSYDFAGSTHEPCALEELWSRIRNKKGKKVIITLHDGMPNHGRTCNCKKCYCDNENRSIVKSLKNIVRKIRHQGGRALSIGIQMLGHKELYPDFAIIQELPQLYPALIKLLQKAIRKY